MAPLFVLSEHYRSADKSGVREYSGGRAASVSLRIFFWLRQKLRCVASQPSVDGKMLAIEPRVRSGAHIPKRNAIHLDGISFWSRIRESNPPPRLGKPMYYRCTNPAYEVFIAVLCTADTGVLRQLRCLRVPAHFLLAAPKAAMLRIAAVLRRQNACDRTRLLGLGSRCTTDVRILRGVLGYHSIFFAKKQPFSGEEKNRASGGRPGGIQQSLAPAGMASSSMTRWSFSSPFSLCTAESSMPHDSWPIIFLGGRLTMAASVLPTRASGS